MRNDVPDIYPSELTAAAAFAVLWRVKWLVVAITLGMAAASLVAALILPKEYQATTLIAPVTMSESGEGMGGGASILSRLGGLSSLVGGSAISMPEAVDVETLKSQLLTQRYIQQNNLLPALFPARWDSAHGRWRTDDNAKVPTLWDGGQFFTKRVRAVAKDGTAGLYRVTVTWRDPEVAARWANGIVALTNDYMRGRAIAAADRNVEYLKEQVDKTSDVDIKSAIYALMEQEIKSAMIAQGQREYALKVIDPAFVPERPYSPLPLQWTGIGLLAGLFTSLIIVLFKARQGMSDSRLPQIRDSDGVRESI